MNLISGAEVIKGIALQRGRQRHIHGRGGLDVATLLSRSEVVLLRLTQPLDARHIADAQIIGQVKPRA